MEYYLSADEWPHARERRSIAFDEAVMAASAGIILDLTSGHAVHIERCFCAPCTDDAAVLPKRYGILRR